jgi:hypothetical protein
MKLKLFVTFVTFAAMLIVGCGDDNPAAPPKSTGPTFNTSQMPIKVPNTTAGSAGLALDGANNLICATFNGVLYSVSKTTGQLSIKAANIGITEGGPFRMMSCVYDPVADRYYTGDISSRIFTVNPTTGDSQLLVNLGSMGVVEQLLKARPDSVLTADNLSLLPMGMSARA